MKKMNVILCALLSVLCLSIFSCQTQTKVLDENSIYALDGQPINPAELDRFLRNQMDSLKIPGLSIAVINNAEVVYSKNFGIIKMIQLKR